MRILPAHTILAISLLEFSAWIIAKPLSFGKLLAKVGYQSLVINNALLLIDQAQQVAAITILAH
jgi:multidrug efflux pump subunit AcrB